MATLRAGALAKLRTSSVTVLIVDRDLRTTEYRARVVQARVRSSRDGVAPYMVDLDNDGWHCTCRSHYRGDPCAHILAVQMVTGHTPSEQP